METISLPLAGGAGEAAVAGNGILITAVRDRDGPKLLRWDGVDVDVVNPTAATPGGSYVFATTPGGDLWSAESGSYVLRHHDLGANSVSFQIWRKAEWFPGDGAIPANIYQLAADSRGRLWVTVGIQAQGAPPGLPPPIQDPEGAAEVISRYRNTLIEVLSMDGHLIAAELFTDGRLIPTPISADRWFLTQDDLLNSIVILEPLLTPR